MTIIRWKHCPYDGEWRMCDNICDVCGIPALNAYMKHIADDDVDVEKLGGWNDGTR